MISLSYFTHSSVELENLAIHAMRLHYKAYFSLIPGRLGVEYVVMIDDKPNVGTWDIWKSDSLQEYATNPEIVGEEEGQDIEELRPASIFCVIYGSRAMHKLIPLLDSWLQEYGGWIILNDDRWRFTRDNLSSLLLDDHS